MQRVPATACKAATHRFKALMMRPAAKTSTLLAYTKMFIGGNAFAELYGLTCGGMQKCSCCLHP